MCGFEIVILPFVLGALDQRLEDSVNFRALFPISLDELLFVFRKLAQSELECLRGRNFPSLEPLMNDSKYGRKSFNPLNNSLFSSRDLVSGYVICEICASDMTEFFGQLASGNDKVRCDGSGS